MLCQKGAVATSNPLAAKVGRDILKAGGNAIDAAIATAAALTVVEPTGCGIGGDAFAIVWFKGEMHGLNISSFAPAKLSAEDVIKAGYSKIPTHGWLPVTVPGVPAAWKAMSDKFGNLPLADLLQPAVELPKMDFL